jgi:uncharacterized repeat protein (TIGR03803 family)
MPALVLAGCVAATNAGHAASEHVVYSFTGGSDGAEPIADLTGAGSTLYGTTFKGGGTGTGCAGNGCGTVFAVTPAGVHTVIHSFTGGQDGSYPWAGLIEIGGTLYGTASGGGAAAWGTVYAMTKNGTATVLYAFKNGLDGGEPLAGLLDIGGTLYGTTYAGGGHPCYDNDGCGTVFALTLTGKEAVVYAFKGGTDGAEPYSTLIGVDGRLYGTTYFGGASGDHGSVFAVTRHGAEKLVHSFVGGTDASHTEAGLIDVGGKLYGTAYEGGANNAGLIFSLTPQGIETVVYSFKGGSDGAQPLGQLIDVAGTLYGTTYAGGANDAGTVFSVTPGGAERVVHSFGKGNDGASPVAGLINVGGVLYGTTSEGGGANAGTVFSLSP